MINGWICGLCHSWVSNFGNTAATSHVCRFPAAAQPWPTMALMQCGKCSWWYNDATTHICPQPQEVKHTYSPFLDDAARWTYAALADWLDEGYNGMPGRERDKHWVHCDQLTLHRKGACEYCDRNPKAQQRRVDRKIPFSGEPGAPDALFRPNETINRWSGNRPKTSA